MEYISPGRLSVTRFLAALTTVLCLVSAGMADSFRQRQKFGPQARHNNIHHSRHPSRQALHQRRPDLYQERPDIHQARPGGFQGRAGAYQGRAGGPNYRYGDFSEYDYDYEDSTVALKPEFLNTETNVTVTEGRMATLPCSVRYLGTKEVAWAKPRAGENNFLTIGKVVWAPDTKINVSFRIDDNQITHWDLQIKNVNKSYAGEYECQITDKSPVKTRVNLIVKPRPPPKPAAVAITGEAFVDRGEPIRLVCNATGPRVPEKIDWFKDGTKLDGTSYRHGNLKIQEYMHVVDQALISELIIRHTDMKNSGTYICRSSDRKIDSLKVTVLVADTTNKKRAYSAGTSVKGKPTVEGVVGKKENPKDAAVNFRHSPLTLTAMAVCLGLLHRVCASILYSPMS